MFGSFWDTMIKPAILKRGFEVKNVGTHKYVGGLKDGELLEPMDRPCNVDVLTTMEGLMVLFGDLRVLMRGLPVPKDMPATVNRLKLLGFASVTTSPYYNIPPKAHPAEITWASELDEDEFKDRFKSDPRAVLEALVPAAAKVPLKFTFYKQEKIDFEGIIYSIIGVS